MKKKSSNVARKKIHKNLTLNLKDYKISKSYKFFKRIILNSLGKKKIACGISGGPDSMALAYFLKCYSIEKNIKIYFYHVDHNLRDSSSNEAILLKNILEKFDIKLKILKWKGIKPKSNIQAKARLERYRLLVNQMKRDKCKSLVLGHTGDDLTENFLMRIMRGSGLEGLTSFSSKSINYLNLILIRPLLNFKKEELIYVTKKVFRSYISDKSNFDVKFKRVRVRNIIKDLSNEGFDTDKINLTIKNLTRSNEAIKYMVEENVKNNSKLLKNKKTILLNKDFFINPKEVVFRSFLNLLKNLSNKYYAPRGKKLVKLLNQIY